MILSNIEIHRALDAGDIVIEPQPVPRLISLDNPSSPYNTTSVDLTLDGSLAISDKSKPMSFDLRKPGIAGLLAKVYDPVVIDPRGGFNLEPGTFVLGKTREVIGLPIRDGRPVYSARVEGRSSFARCGLLVHFTAPTIHAGFEGSITLEIMNFGMHPIVLTIGLPIAQLILEEVKGTPVRNDSQFHKQQTPAGTAR